MINRLFLFLFFPLLLFSKQIETFYGAIDVDEPVLLELIDSPFFQRLKEIHQYGVSYYVSHHEEYNRYDHSLGVFALLHKENCSLKEQIAGLLHDVSHTVFSHVGDWIFGKEYHEKDYQNSIHKWFLVESNIEKILTKYGYSIEELLPEEHLFAALERSLPDLCADRIDYNIQGAYHQGFLSLDEAVELYEDIHFQDGKWIITKEHLAKKISLFSLFMSKDCWGSPHNYFHSRHLADAILRALEIGEISLYQIHFGADQKIWNLLYGHEDREIQKHMELLFSVDERFFLVGHGKGDLLIRSKFRGIDPWIQKEGKLFRLTELDFDYAQEYKQQQEEFQRGWAISFKEHRDHSFE